MDNEQKGRQPTLTDPASKRMSFQKLERLGPCTCSTGLRIIQKTLPRHGERLAMKKRVEQIAVAWQTSSLTKAPVGKREDRATSDTDVRKQNAAKREPRIAFVVGSKPSSCRALVLYDSLTPAASLRG